MTAKGVSKPQRNWTTTEVEAAAALWGNGATTAAIARALGRGHGSVGTKIKGDRVTFPPRNVDYGKTGKKTDMKVRFTPFMTAKVREAAAAKGISVSNLLQGIVRDALVAKKR